MIKAKSEVDLKIRHFGDKDFKRTWLLPLLGHIEQFDSAVEQWTQYVERLEQFFVANDVIGDDKAVKRRATFLLVVGRDAYNLLRSLKAPATDRTFEELVAVL